jgi:hypothetical protein
MSDLNRASTSEKLLLAVVDHSFGTYDLMILQKHALKLQIGAVERQLSKKIKELERVQGLLAVDANIRERRIDELEKLIKKGDKHE